MSKNKFKNEYYLNHTILISKYRTTCGCEIFQQISSFYLPRRSNFLDVRPPTNMYRSLYLPNYPTNPTFPYFQA